VVLEGGQDTCTPLAGCNECGGERFILLDNLTSTLILTCAIVLLLLPSTPLKDKLLLMYEDSLSQLTQTTYNTIVTPPAPADNFNKSTNVSLTSACVSHISTSRRASRAIRSANLIVHLLIRHLLPDSDFLCAHPIPPRPFSLPTFVSGALSFTPFLRLRNFSRTHCTPTGIHTKTQNRHTKHKHTTD
jgi:hypothetical protein